MREVEALGAPKVDEGLGICFRDLKYGVYDPYPDPFVASEGNWAEKTPKKERERQFDEQELADVYRDCIYEEVRAAIADKQISPDALVSLAFVV